MEARSSLKGTAVSKTFVAAVLIIVAIGLGIMGAYLAVGLSGSKAATPSHTIVAPSSGAALTPDAQDRNDQFTNARPARVRPLHAS
jgi:hypothetical protein